MTTIATKRNLEKTYRVEDDGEVKRRPSLESVVADWLIAKDITQQALAHEKELADKIKLAFGESSYIQAGDYTCSYKLQTRKAHWVEATLFRVLRLEK